MWIVKLVSLIRQKLVWVYSEHNRGLKHIQTVEGRQRNLKVCEFSVKGIYLSYQIQIAAKDLRMHKQLKPLRPQNIYWACSVQQARGIYF